MFGDELRRARLSSGLTQAELAARADVHRTYVSMLERDEKSPTLDVLFRLCDALEVPLSTLVAKIEAGRDPTASSSASHTRNRSLDR